MKHTTIVVTIGLALAADQGRGRDLRLGTADYGTYWSTNVESGRPRQPTQTGR